MFLILTELDEFDDDDNRQRLLPVLQIDTAHPIDGGRTHIRTAGGDSFTVAESFAEIVARIETALDPAEGEFEGDELLAE